MDRTDHCDNRHAVSAEPPRSSFFPPTHPKIESLLLAKRAGMAAVVHEMPGELRERLHHEQDHPHINPGQTECLAPPEVWFRNRGDKQSWEHHICPTIGSIVSMGVDLRCPNQDYRVVVGCNLNEGKIAVIRPRLQCVWNESGIVTDIILGQDRVTEPPFTWLGKCTCYHGQGYAGCGCGYEQRTLTAYHNTFRPADRISQLYQIRWEPMTFHDRVYELEYDKLPTYVNPKYPTINDAWDHP